MLKNVNGVLLGRIQITKYFNLIAHPRVKRKTIYFRKKKQFHNVNLEQKEQTNQTGTVKEAKMTLETVATDGTKDLRLSLSVDQRVHNERDTDT